MGVGHDGLSCKYLPRVISATGGGSVRPRMLELLHLNPNHQTLNWDRLKLLLRLYIQAFGRFTWIEMPVRMANYIYKFFLLLTSC
jgi:hypothetical protein